MHSSLKILLHYLTGVEVCIFTWPFHHLYFFLFFKLFLCPFAGVLGIFVLLHDQIFAQFMLLDRTFHLSEEYSVGKWSSSLLKWLQVSQVLWLHARQSTVCFTLGMRYLLCLFFPQTWRCAWGPNISTVVSPFKGHCCTIFFCVFWCSFENVSLIAQIVLFFF